MKLIASLIVLFGCFVAANAQTLSLLPVDEQGKFIYYEVVDAKNLSKVQLKNNAVAYFKKQPTTIKLKSTQGDSSFIANGKMVINKTLLVMSHPSGEILYQFQVELKEGKYRFWLNNFSFIPYQRDRYGNFVAATAIGTPLENEPGKLNASQWKEYQTQTAKYAKDLATDFKEYMEGKMPLANVNPSQKIVSKIW